MEIILHIPTPKTACAMRMPPSHPRRSPPPATPCPQCCSGAGAILYMQDFFHWKGGWLALTLPPILKDGAPGADACAQRNVRKRENSCARFLPSTVPTADCDCAPTENESSLSSGPTWYRIAAGGAHGPTLFQNWARLLCRTNDMGRSAERSTLALPV